MYINSFEQQKKKGQEVEQIVKRHLEQRGHTVTDLTDNPDFWKQDIDFIITDRATTKSISLEIKRDDNIYKTGNLFFEIGFDKQDYYSQGWLEKCKAEYLCYYDSVKRHGFILDFPKTKLLLPSIGKEHYYWDKLDQCGANALLVPLWKARKEELIVYEWQD